jgi:DNA-directed RNA polymerase subunit L
MKELIKRFQNFREEHPALGDVIIMSMTVEGKQYPKEVIQRAFNKLVSEEEYEQDEKREIIESLLNYSQKPLIS